MSDNRLKPHSRPVADAPLEALLARTEDLARRWAIALIQARPLESIGEIPLGDLAREMPELCGQALRALASEAELERLIGQRASRPPMPGAAARLADLAGARDPASTVGAVEALRVVLWGALLAELRDPDPRQVAELAERLAAVCSLLAMALLDAGHPASAGDVPPSQESLLSQESEHEPSRPERRQPEPRAAAGEEPVLESPPESPSASPWQEQPQIQIRDVRGEGPTAWIGSIGRRLERHEEDGLPFAVLLVEVVDMERLAQAGSAAELSSLIGKVEGALSEELRPADLLTRESQGRYWLVTPETDGVGVRMLAERLARSVRISASDHGAPLEIAIGIAVCPDDGRDAATLAAHADVGVYAARASGRSIAPAEEQ